jgi:hypothetical protein
LMVRELFPKKTWIQIVLLFPHRDSTPHHWNTAALIHLS